MYGIKLNYFFDLPRFVVVKYDNFVQPKNAVFTSELDHFSASSGSTSHLHVASDRMMMSFSEFA